MQHDDDRSIAENRWKIANWIILTFSLSFARHQRATSQVRAIIIFKIHFHLVPAIARPHILHKVNLLITINHLSLFSRHCASGRGSRGLMLDHARRSTITLVRHTWTGYSAWPSGYKCTRCMIDGLDNVMKRGVDNKSVTTQNSQQKINWRSEWDSRIKK